MRPNFATTIVERFRTRQRSSSTRTGIETSFISFHLDRSGVAREAHPPEQGLRPGSLRPFLRGKPRQRSSSTRTGIETASSGSTSASRVSPAREAHPPEQGLRPRLSPQRPQRKRGGQRSSSTRTGIETLWGDGAMSGRTERAREAHPPEQGLTACSTLNLC